jgi:23S rRNA (cytidine1920-2'-O)/16S rRNA (cytidine1409-2'-O)-methyltransferase
MSLRLDQILTARGLAPTRSRARDLILRGLVLVDGAVQMKPGALIADRAVLSVSGETDYVSRGALKLAAALDEFGFDADGRVALDVGASTGGFTDVLLTRGAIKVYAVDVGHGQLHQKLKDDARVISLEGRDARSLGREDVPEPVGAIVADVSFISLEKALPAALSLAAHGAWLVALVKPQFEAGRGAVGKGGIVRDAAVREAQGARIQAWLDQQPGWQSAGLIPSPIQGGSGNEEYLVGARFVG